MNPQPSCALTVPSDFTLVKRPLPSSAQDTTRPTYQLLTRTDVIQTRFDRRRVLFFLPYESGLVNYREMRTMV